MPREIVTITDDQGHQWKGPLVAVGRIDNRGLLWGLLTDGISMLFQHRKYVTIDVYGELRSGQEVKVAPQSTSCGRRS